MRVFTALLRGEAERRDRANIRMLKQIVEMQGWPKLSEVGPRAANAAWLLAQHADHDPAFQLRILREMEPMLKTGEVNKRNFAYLHDRVMLVLVGKQRYGTQLTCEAGHRVPRPLEDAARIDALRAAVGLEPLAEYLAAADRIYGKGC